MNRLFLLLLLFSFTLFADTNSTENNSSNNTDMNISISVPTAEEIKLQEEKKSKIQSYIQQLASLEEEMSKEKVWTKSYASYLTSIQFRNNLQDIQDRIKFLKDKAKTASQQDELNSLISKKKVLTNQMQQLKEKKSAPFSTLLTPPSIGDVPEINNPFDIFSGLSFIKKLNLNLNEYLNKEEILKDIIALLKKENKIYLSLRSLDADKRYEIKHKAKVKELEIFETALETIEITANVYQKRLEVIEIAINKNVKEQIYGVIRMFIIISIVFFIFFLLKLMVKKYITDNERFYMANKIITFTNFTVIILILFFSYIENAGYLVTILGFASAGIAIAMKDWFMSILGWLVIVFGGSIHVGDRIRVDMDGKKYVGDIVDISLLRMTILEDITLTSIMTNRRAGRIIFIPNNYVFTRMIANYTHSSLKTVWDGVKITITFDSNHKKAMQIAKDITRKFSKGYTDITRKQLNKLRHNYSLKNTNVDPRIYSFIEPNGIDIEAWYLTNAYATLTLRSVISMEIIEAFKKEDDITIAYPTQKLHISDERRTEINSEDELA